MTNGDDFERMIRPFELLDRNLISARCHMHIYKRINVLAEQMEITGKDADAIIAIRAGSITSALVSLVACLDVHHAKYPDRASIGGLIHRLKTQEYTDYFSQYHSSVKDFEKGRKALSKKYNKFRSSGVFKKASKLRNNAVAHILDLDDTPTVTYACLDVVSKNVQEMCDLAFAVLGCGRQTHTLYEARHAETADWLVETYTKGMQA